MPLLFLSKFERLTAPSLRPCRVVTPVSWMNRAGWTKHKQRIDWLIFSVRPDRLQKVLFCLIFLTTIRKSYVSRTVYKMFHASIIPCIYAVYSILLKCFTAILNPLCQPRPTLCQLFWPIPKTAGIWSGVNVGNISCLTTSSLAESL